MSKSSFRATPRAQPCTDAGPTFDEAPIGRPSRRHESGLQKRK